MVVSFSIKLAASLASGSARMKLHLFGAANRAEYRITNRRMSKGGIAPLSHLYKIDRIPYFVIRHSLFDIRYSLFQSFFIDLTGRFLADGSADPIAQNAEPRTRNLEP